jgi:lipopolysaccharide/colanic/teichoic acid biosynthesis glycosyltransferase
MKRTFDLLVSIALLLPVALLGVAIAIVAAIGDRGPVFYRSRRLGRGGRPFDMWKFRTMYVGGERHLTDAQRATLRRDFKLVGDPRVTPVGRWLRRTSLDELPQLLNVIRGDMSVIGPRPKLPEELERWGTSSRELLSVRPGITGLWQVLRTSAASDDAMRRLDLEYVHGHGFFVDLRILAATPRALLRRVDD